LGFSVTVFSSCAVLTVATLVLRRVVLGYELGGPAKIKYACGFFLTCLWLVYIGMSVGNTYHLLPAWLTF